MVLAEPSGGLIDHELVSRLSQDFNSTRWARDDPAGMALFQVYTNPWIVRGVLQVAWVAGKYLTSP